MGMPLGDRDKRGEPLQSPGSPPGCVIFSLICIKGGYLEDYIGEYGECSEFRP